MSAVLGNDGCFHCGLPVPQGGGWTVSIDDAAREMCCPGCAAVAQGIVDAGLAAYYRSRTAFSERAGEGALVPPELALYDEAQPPVTGDLAEATFSVEGIRCAACVWLIEGRLARLPGVATAEMNVATERLTVRWSAEKCKPSDILQALRRVGYAAYPYDTARHGAALERARKKLFRQLFIAGLSMMQVMMYAVPVYLADDGTMDADMTALMHWASLLLTLPAVLYSAQPFFRGAWINLKQRMPGMDVPVALGIAAAFAGSVWSVLRGQGEVWFDSVTMFIFLLLASRYLELVARRKAATALEKLQHALPASALRMPGYPKQRETEVVAAASLCEGDMVLVRPGEALAADGVIAEGGTELDLALLTGESRAQPRRPGDAVPGGAVNAGQAIVLRVTRGARDSTLSRLVALVERAGQGRPQIALWADTVAAWFVAALLALTVAVFVAWQFVDPARAWEVAIAVLVVSCPCALSLATPTALAAATDRLVRKGVLVVKPHVLETLHRATHVVFDKTGTLTAGKPALRHVGVFGAAGRERCLQVAAALEATSAHPLGAAIREASLKAVLQAQDVTSEMGQGIEGSVDGRVYRLGRASFVAAISGELPEPDAAGMTSVYLGDAGGVLARFDLADSLRDDAQAVVRAFQRSGKQVILLSGDDQRVTDGVAAELGIGDALGAQLPAGKLAFVRDLQAKGAVVAMAGDGINDAAVLSAADVSFAMGGGAALAQLNADCLLLGGRLAALEETRVTAARALAVVRQNLWWASIYNMVAIPAAAIGLLNPWMAGAGMSLSSAVVVINALRLRGGA
ncbi:heavy metal translocating P-type ATPase [Massilia cavernae]|uniref:Heavy metal translocating P-type ATPase n=1 Tax=Massilia cavernae TaxID=2320864 RepID=A0A418XR19_9BURK|nr:heavy metal translocating P-type ATPase [Massilia cavernae]RJG14953.1 heavy metal translocating P-type ATPase [Massilia cavernae]